jgi:aminotransferase
VAMAQIYENMIAVNSLSKSNALTGLRLGWALGSEKIVEQIAKAHAWTVSCADTFAQRLALDVFATNSLQEHATWYRQRLPHVLDALEESGLCFIRPEGAFYACVKLPPGVKSFDAAVALAEHYDVIAIPGIAFGACFEGWRRLSWVAPVDALSEGLRRIVAFCSTFEEPAAEDLVRRPPIR